MHDWLKPPRLLHRLTAIYSICLAFFVNSPALAEDVPIWVCKAERMLEVRENFELSEKDWSEEFVLTQENNILNLKFADGHVWELPIQYFRGGDLISADKFSHWSFWNSGAELKRYSHFHASPLGSRLYEGLCQSFG